MNPRKILLVCDKNECTSFGRITLNMAKAVKDFFEVHILWLKTPKFFDENSSGTYGSEEFIHHEVWAKSLEMGFFKFPPLLKKLSKQIQPDLVFFIRPELGFLVPVVKHSKTIMLVHDTFAETLYPNSLKFKLLNLFFIKPTVKADYFVYNSNWTKKQAVDFFGNEMSKKRGAVIGCSIDKDLFSKPLKPPTAKEKDEFRCRYGIKNFEGMCLNVSLDEPRKNIETFFEMGRLRPNIAFVRVGRLSLRLKKILEEKKLHNIFHFRELTALELRDFYIHADLMVYPSFLEGFGLPPIEAISCGTPAVCAATSAVKENLQGVCPLVENPKDAASFALILDKVLKGEQVINKEAAEKLLSSCSMESFSKRVVDFFKSL